MDRGVRLLVVSEAEYEQHLAQLQEQGQTGQIDAPLRGAYSQTPLNEAESDR